MPTKVYQTGTNGDILDATLDEENPTVNDGTAPSLAIGFVIPSKQGFAKRAVFAITMDLPAGIIITSATLTLEWTDTVVGGLVHELRRLLDDVIFHPFLETVTTWIDRGFATPWATPGGDFADPTKVFTAPDSSSQQVIDVTAFTIDAYENRSQDWWAIIKRQTESGTTDLKKVVSSEGTAAQRPKLTVNFLEPRLPLLHAG